MYPVIVIGPPYSGTSVVARLLQTKFDIMIDEGPLKADAYKPLGYYEDHKIMEINKIFYDYYLPKIGKETEIKAPIQWATSFASWLVYRGTKYEKWGWKDPACIGLVKYMHQFLDNPTWIICNRTDKQMIKSQIKKSGFPKDIAIAGLKAYKEIVKREFGDEYNQIDLSEHKEDHEIVRELEAILCQ